MDADLPDLSLYSQEERSQPQDDHNDLGTQEDNNDAKQKNQDKQDQQDKHDKQDQQENQEEVQAKKHVVLNLKFQEAQSKSKPAKRRRLLVKRKSNTANQSMRPRLTNAKARNAPNESTLSLPILSQATPKNATTKRKSSLVEGDTKRAKVESANVSVLESRDPATLEGRFKGCMIVKDVCVASLVDSGAFGAVFACKTPKGKRIAKIGATPKQVKALVDEFGRYKELSSIKSLAPFLLKTYSLVTFNDLLGNACRAITMDYGGIDLFAMMKQKGMTALNLADTKLLGRRVLLVLKAFHLAGYVHRDVKPQNILILPAKGHGFASMSIKLIDFGLVTKWDPKSKVVAKRALTCGTARFSSWRQQLGYTAHPHDDLESLVYTMVFLLGGKLPWSSAWSDEPAKHLERDANMSAIKQKTNCEALCLKLDAKKQNTGLERATTNFATFLQTVRDSTTFNLQNYTVFSDLCA
jgi:hypothetical protein